MDSTDILIIILISLAVVMIIVTFVFLYFMNGIEKRYESEINKGTVVKKTTEDNEIGEKEKERGEKFVEDQKKIREIQIKEEEEEEEKNDERRERLIRGYYNRGSRYTADAKPPKWYEKLKSSGLQGSARPLETSKPSKPSKPWKLPEDTFENLFVG